MRIRIRPATSADLPALQDIERAAGAAFRDLGMAAIADDEPPTLAALERHRRSGRAWVAVEERDRPVAYLVAEPVDHALHIEQVSVHPDAAHRRIGRSLLDHAADHAHEQGLTALTLTTFADVPWNAPYYERLGFRVLTGPDVTPGLHRIRAHETEPGLDAWPRVCMRREVRSDALVNVTHGPRPPLTPPRTSPAAPPSAPSPTPSSERPPGSAAGSGSCSAPTAPRRSLAAPPASAGPPGPAR